MDQFIRISEFAQYVFDQKRIAEQAAIILQGIWESGSARLSDIAQHMPGKSDANYKAIQRFLQRSDPKGALLRLFQPHAPFVIGDPTEIPRTQATRPAMWASSRTARRAVLACWCWRHPNAGGPSRSAS